MMAAWTAWSLRSIEPAGRDRFKTTGDLLPWQSSSRPFDFDSGFVGWINQRYLPVALNKEGREIERWQAVQDPNSPEAREARARARRFLQQKELAK